MTIGYKPLKIQFTSTGITPIFHFIFHSSGLKVLNGFCRGQYIQLQSFIWVTNGIFAVVNTVQKRQLTCAGFKSGSHQRFICSYDVDVPGRRSKMDFSFDVTHINLAFLRMRFSLLFSLITRASLSCRK